MMGTPRGRGPSCPAGSSVGPPAGVRDWPGSEGTGSPAACWPPRLSSAWPAALGVPLLPLSSALEAQGWGLGNPPPSWGLPEPLTTLTEGLFHPAPAVHPPCLYRGTAGSGAMPEPIKPARGIKVSRMQLCLLDLTRPEGRYLQPEFTAP